MELTISNVPGRQGKWLVVEEGSVFRPIAKFRDDASLDLFKEWARQSNGKIFHFVAED